MNKLHVYLFLILFCSCTNKENDVKVEIYFLKDKILSDEGVLLKDTRVFKRLRLDTVLYYWNRKNEKFDTITNQVIYGGKYKVYATDLEAEPFINDSEILMLSKDKSEILLRDLGFKKLQNLKYKSDDGRQFVITVNKKPVLNGYLTSRHSSKVFSHNYLVFQDSFPQEKSIENHPLEIFCVDNYAMISKSIKTDLNKYPVLIKAFEKTKRLK